MSDLTKAIHAQMDTWARSGREETIALAADRYDGAIRMLLGWADRMESGIGGPSAVGKAFADQLREVLADALGVSGEDRSEPTPAPERQWAVEHPDVITTAHNSEWSVLYTLSKLPGGRIVVRDAPDQPWRLETACLCVTVPDTGHYAGCPDTSEVVTPEGTS